MEKIKNFYNSLPQKKKIIFWVSIFFIIFSFLEIGIWKKTRRKILTEKFFLKKLKSPNPQERKLAIYGVGVKKMKEAVPVLEEIIEKEKDPQLKRVAAYSLGRIDNDKLIKYLSSQNKEVRDIALETLVKLDKKNIDYLLENFDDFGKDIKFGILSYVERYSKSSYQDKLMDIVEDREENIGIRKKALSIIGKIGNKNLVERLWDLYYSEEDENMKEEIKNVIKKIKGGENV